MARVWPISRRESPGGRGRGIRGGGELEEEQKGSEAERGPPIASILFRLFASHDPHYNSCFLNSILPLVSIPLLLFTCCARVRIWILICTDLVEGRGLGGRHLGRDEEGSRCSPSSEE